jgi:hypothetical protein
MNATMPVIAHPAAVDQFVPQLVPRQGGHERSHCVIDRPR